MSPKHCGSLIYEARSHHNSVSLLCWIFYWYQLGSPSPGLDWLRNEKILRVSPCSKTLDWVVLTGQLYTLHCRSFLFSLRPGRDAGRPSLACTELAGRVSRDS